jgi:hypothetical protein
MSWWIVVLVVLGLLNGLAAAATAVVALNRVLRPLGQISRYADETLAAARGIAHNLEGVDEAARTRELVQALGRGAG